MGEQIKHETDTGLSASPGTPNPGSPLNVAVIIGSVRDSRLGGLIGRWFARRAADHGDLIVELIDLAEEDLPLAGTQPGGCTSSSISQRLDAADAFVVVTPEYNHSYPAALKNAIDWHYREWKFKPVAFVSYGAGSGGIRAVEQLRLVFAELYATTARNAVAINAPWELIGPDGQFTVSPQTEGAAVATLDELTWWAEALRAARQAKPFTG
jgi:NAD(P)H-dependent FMN reductase